MYKEFTELDGVQSFKKLNLSSTVNRKQFVEGKDTGVIDKEDLYIWPIDMVEVNFKRFLQQTLHLNYNQSLVSEDFLIDQCAPDNKELAEIFEYSVRKVSGRQNKKKWKDNEKILLKWIILRYSLLYQRKSDSLMDEDWRRISKLIIGRNASQCKYKWLARNKFKLFQNPWSPLEDQSLISVYLDYQKQGKLNKWSDMAKEIALRCKTDIVRQGKQCRERWINKLDPQISKIPWSKEEELKILKLIILKGKKWSEISKLLSNSRTENSLKNRYHTLMKKERHKQNYLGQQEHNDVSELIEQLKFKHKLVNPVHLYEDIDASELQIILQLISKLEEYTGVYELDIEEGIIKDQNEIVFSKINLADSQKQRRQENSIIIKQEFLSFQDKQDEILIDKVEKKVQMQIPTDTINDQRVQKLIFQILQKQTQESEMDNKKIELEYMRTVESLGTRNCNFEMENIQNLNSEDAGDMQLSFIDDDTKVAYIIPNEFVIATINQLKNLSQNQNLQTLAQAKIINDQDQKKSRLS